MKRSKIAILFASTLLTLAGCVLPSSPLVKEKALKVSELPITVRYVVGDTFYSAGLEVVDQDNKIVNDYTLDPANGSILNTVGDITVTVSKETYKSTSFTINVREGTPPVDEEELRNAKEEAINELNSYYQSFDLDEYDDEGRAALLRIKNNAIANINQARTVSAVQSLLANAKSEMDNVPKKEIPDERILVRVYCEAPYTTQYAVNDEIDLNGLRVFAVYEGFEDPEEVFSYTVEQVQLTSVGKKTVNITYKTFTTSFDVNVVAKDLSGSYTIDIYATNDMHGIVYEDLSSYARAGLGRTLTYLKKHNDGNTLLLDQGDTWQGSLYSNENRGALFTDAMNYVQYNSRTIGNHDFDWGVEPLKANKKRSYNGYRTPVLGANIYDYNFTTKTVGNEFQTDLAEETVTYTLDNGIKVGIVGVIGEGQITSICTKYVENIAFTSHIGAIKTKATELRNKGCDIVIASIHGGEEDAKNCGLKDYVDLVLCAHTHKLEISHEEELYFAQFGSYTYEIGHVSLTYDSDAKDVTNTIIEEIGYNAIASETQTIDSEINKIIDEYADSIDVDPNAIVASNTYGTFASREELPNAMCEAIYHEAVKEGVQVDLAYCNESRYTLNKPYWTFADVYQAFPFENEIFVIEITYSELMREIVGYNNVYKSPDFDWKVSSNQKVRVACIDYLAFHTNSRRYYDYFPDNNGNYVAKLTKTYRNILIDWLKDEGYADGRVLFNTQFSSTMAPFRKTFNRDVGKLEFRSNYGENEVLKRLYVEVGEQVNLYYPDVNPTREGYTFTGWYTDSGCNNPAIDLTMQAGGLVLYAGWVGGEVVGNDGSYEHPFTVTEAVTHISKNGNDGNVYYVKGTVTGEIVKSSYNDNLKFDITDGVATMTAYYVMTNGLVPSLGDEVIISGQLMLYDGRIYETASGTGTLVEILNK